MNRLAVSSVGVNIAVKEALDILESPDMFRLLDLNTSLDKLSIAIEMFATALEDFQQDATPFIGDDDDE